MNVVAFVGSVHITTYLYILRSVTTYEKVPDTFPEPVHCLRSVSPVVLFVVVLNADETFET